MAKLTANKAKEMLRHREVHDKPLTSKQKRYFGYVAGGGKAQTGGWMDKYQDGGEIKPYNNSLKANVGRLKGRFRESVPESFRMLVPVVSDVEDLAYLSDAWGTEGTALDRVISTGAFALPIIGSNLLKKPVKKVANYIKDLKAPYTKYVFDPKNYDPINDIIRGSIETKAPGILGKKSTEVTSMFDPNVSYLKLKPPKKPQSAKIYSDPIKEAKSLLNKEDPYIDLLEYHINPYNRPERFIKEPEISRIVEQIEDPDIANAYKALTQQGNKISSLKQMSTAEMESIGLRSDQLRWVYENAESKFYENTQKFLDILKEYEPKKLKKISLKEYGGEVDAITGPASKLKIANPEKNNSNWLINKIRENLSENLYPAGYSKLDQTKIVNNKNINIAKRVISAAIGKKEPSRWDDETSIEAGDYRINEEERLYRFKNRVDWNNLYFNQSQKYNTVYNSEYKPSIRKSELDKYYTSNLIKAKLKNLASYGDTTLVGSFEGDYSNTGRHKISFGGDEKGKYFSYYDKWDLSPFGGNKDQSMGLGNPLEIYDRIYVDQDSTGRYVPREKFKSGGHLKKSKELTNFTDYNWLNKYD